MIPRGSYFWARKSCFIDLGHPETSRVFPPTHYLQESSSHIMVWWNESNHYAHTFPHQDDVTHVVRIFLQNICWRKFVLGTLRPCHEKWNDHIVCFLSFSRAETPINHVTTKASPCLSAASLEAYTSSPMKHLQISTNTKPSECQSPAHHHDPITTGSSLPHL